MKLRFPAACVAFGTLAVSATSAVVAQSAQGPTFRSAVEVVQLDVSVLDENRQPIKGLTADDFIITVRGTAQPIVSFTEIDLPPRPVDGAAWLRDVAPDVTNNHHNTQRVVVILMDDCNVPFNPMFAKIARRIADDTISMLGPDDIASVVYTGIRRSGQEFTVDRARLRASVERFSPLGVGAGDSDFSAANRNITAAEGRYGAPTLAIGMAPSSQCYRAVPQALDNAAQSLRAYSGWRKTLVFISPFAPQFAADSIESSDDLGLWGRVFDAMQEANLTLYQYDPRGLEVGAGLAPEVATLAEATGGRAVKATNAPELGVPQMFLENSSYYMLGFQPTSQTRSGRFRAIDVRVKRPGAIVRTRSGYFEPREESAPRRSGRSEPTQLERAVAGALPSGDLPMSLAVAPVAQGGSRNAAVGVIAGFTQVGTANARNEYEMLVRAFRDDWRPAGMVSQSFEVATKPTGSGPLHIDLAARLELPPGRYEIRAAVTNVTSGTTGSAYASVVVPDHRREPISLSGVMLERVPRASGGTSTLSGVVPIEPTTMREFGRTDRVTAFVRVSRRESERASDVDVRARIVDAQDAARYTHTMVLHASQFAPGGSADVTLDLPIADLPPGEYLLTIDASAADATARRDVRVSVRP